MLLQQEQDVLRQQQLRAAEQLELVEASADNSPLMSRPLKALHMTLPGGSDLAGIDRHAAIDAHAAQAGQDATMDAMEGAGNWASGAAEELQLTPQSSCTHNAVDNSNCCCTFSALYDSPILRS